MLPVEQALAITAIPGLAGQATTFSYDLHLPRVAWIEFPPLARFAVIVHADHTVARSFPPTIRGQTP